VIAYVDSSALVKLFLDERDSDIARDMWESGVPLATSRVSHAEVACALAAAVRSGRDGRGDVDVDVVDGGFFHRRANFVEVDAAVVGNAAVFGVRHGLSGLDAIHVASAVTLSDFMPVFVSWDERQRRAARAEGLGVYPETITAAFR
jgi:predicted nucleic acid-binding protein